MWAHRSRWRAAAGLVAGTRDILEGRPGTGGTPQPLVTRGWDDFLLSLDDAELEAIEVHGHDAPWPARTPPDLRELLAAARDVCVLPAFAPPGAGSRSPRRSETPRKRLQVAAFGRLIGPLAARATRVVDVGSGHGHLTREIAETLALPVVGLERDAVLARRARALSSGRPVTYTVTDVLRDGLALAAGDCVVGLHACGELGDAMVAYAARTPDVTLALVGCCLQKRPSQSRPPLQEVDGIEASRLDLPRPLLGLSNLTSSDRGVEATRAENIAGRERRLALNWLLSEAGLPVRLGAEIEGINRRTARRALPVLVERAFAARGLPPPTASSIQAAALWAREHHARARRLSLPRAMLARVLEVYVLHDRAAHLVESGLTVHLGVLFPLDVSARNLALVAS